MAVRLYRNFMKLCEKWPIDRTKSGRDLGSFIRQQVVKEFRYGEASTVDNIEDCEQKYESLLRLSSNYHGQQYKRYNITTASCLTLQECTEVLSTENLERLKESEMSAWEKLKFKFW